MKIAVRLFLSSMTFGIAIATLYALTTHDAVGAIFLGIMALALVIVAIYIVVAEREANLAGDHADMTPADTAGEDLGTFTIESYWPILAAAGTAVTIVGLTFAPGAALDFVLLGGALIAWTLRFLVREST